MRDPKRPVDPRWCDDCEHGGKLLEVAPDVYECRKGLRPAFVLPEGPDPHEPDDPWGFYREACPWFTPEAE